MFDFDVVTGPSCFPAPAPRVAPPKPIETRPAGVDAPPDSRPEGVESPPRITSM